MFMKNKTAAERAEMVARVRGGESAFAVSYEFDVDILELLGLVHYHEEDAVEMVHEV